MAKKYLLSGFFSLLVICFLGLISCSRQATVVVSSGTGSGKPLPPGQAKKVYGGSATDYAPGQKKKNGH